MAGRWDDALDRVGEVETWDASGEMSAMLAVLPIICVNRGLDAGLEKIKALARDYEGSSDVQRAGARATALSIVCAGEGKHAESLEFAFEGVRSGRSTHWRR